MIPGTHFIPRSATRSDFEVNHLGVVIRCRGGQLEHIGGVRREHEPQLHESGELKGKPNHLAPYLERTVQLQPVGDVVIDEHRDGIWLVPPKAKAAFEAWFVADIEYRAQQAKQLELQRELEARAKAEAAAKRAKKSSAKKEG